MSDIHPSHREDPQVNEDEATIRNFIDKRMREELSMEQIKKIRVRSRSFGIEGLAGMVGGDGRVLVDFGDGISHWIPQSDLEMVPEQGGEKLSYQYKNADDMLVRNFIAAKLTASFKIDQPKGFLDVSKQVRLVVGEGDDKIEVGKAQVDPMPNGDARVTLSITNAALIKALGGSVMQGIIPNVSDAEEDSNG
jgi:hypothetical protein